MKERKKSKYHITETVWIEYHIENGKLHTLDVCYDNGSIERLSKQGIDIENWYDTTSEMEISIQKVLEKYEI